MLRPVFQNQNQGSPSKGGTNEEGGNGGNVNMNGNGNGGVVAPQQGQQQRGGGMNTSAGVGSTTTNVTTARMPTATPSTAVGSQLHLRSNVGRNGGEREQQGGSQGTGQGMQGQASQGNTHNQTQFGMQFSPTSLDSFGNEWKEENTERRDGEQDNTGNRHGGDKGRGNGSKAGGNTPSAAKKASQEKGVLEQNTKNASGSSSSMSPQLQREGSPLSVKPIVQQQQQPSSYIIQDLGTNNPFVRLRDLLDNLPTWAFLLLLTLLELAVAYPLIGKQDRCDFDCYMQFGNAVLAGERDYSNLECQLGPDYYPAGFTWLYAAVAYICNWNYVRAQLLGMVAYVMHHVVAAHLFTRYAKLPKHLLLICFPFLTNHAWHVTIPKVTNDVYPTLVIVICVWAVLSDRLWLASLMYTTAVALKMNNLFYGPPLLIWYLLRLPLPSVIKHFAFMGVYQIAVAGPFLMVAPIQYVKHAFNFSRDFTWSNNYAWKFLGKDLATAKAFGLGLLLCTVVTLGVFYYILLPTLKRAANRYKIAFDGNNQGQKGRMRSSSIKQLSSNWMDSSIETEAVIALFLGSNLIGYAFSKGIHVQFILWISWTIPFLLHHTRVMGVSLVMAICFIVDEAYYTVLYDMLRIGRFDVNNSVLLALFHFGTLGLSLWHWFSVSRFQKGKDKTN